MMAQEEKLGDVRLYRVPIAVTVAAKSQKQVALMRQPSVAVDTVYRLRPEPGEFETALERVLVTRNDKGHGLGLPLPSGGIALFAENAGRRLLIGEGTIDDHTLGEKVEIHVGDANGIRARQTVLDGASRHERMLRVTNDSSGPRTVEIELPLNARPAKGARLVKRDGWMLWRSAIPANGAAELRYTLPR